MTRQLRVQNAFIFQNFPRFVWKQSLACNCRMQGCRYTGLTRLPWTCHTLLCLYRSANSWYYPLFGRVAVKFRITACLLTPDTFVINIVGTIIVLTIICDIASSSSFNDSFRPSTHQCIIKVVSKFRIPFPSRAVVVVTLRNSSSSNLESAFNSWPTVKCHQIGPDSDVDRFTVQKEERSYQVSNVLRNPPCPFQSVVTYSWWTHSLLISYI